MKASLSNVTRLPNTHRSCTEGERIAGRTDIIHRRIQNTEWRILGKRECSGNFSNDWIRLFGDSLLNPNWVSSTLGIFCVHAM